MADPDRIRAVADHVVETHNSGSQVCVVVSAMGKATDELVRLAHDVSKNPAGRELDMLLTAGERISMSLLCMAIIDRGVHAVSFTGSQAGIVTDTVHGKAKILEVKGDRIREVLAQGGIAVVAGFQGISTSRDITTLGRGGSDTTAVALAAALEAETCEIYTDVPGIFTADPRVVRTQRSWRESLTTKCWRWPQQVGEYSLCDRLSLQGITACECTFARASHGSTGPGLLRRTLQWSKQLLVESHTKPLRQR